MLAIIISILDKLIKLKEYRDQRVQKVFQQVLEPIFNDLLSVHRDYIKMFEKAKTMLPTPDLSWKEFHRGLSEAADFLKEKRVEFEPARIKLKLMLGEIIGDTEASSHKVSFGAQADSFIDNVASYFQSEKGMAYVLTTRYELPFGRGFSSPSTELIEEIKELNEFMHRASETLDESLETFLPLDLIVYDENSDEDPDEYAKTRDGKPVYENFVASLDMRIAHLREKWALVCESFAELKIYVMTRG